MSARIATPQQHPDWFVTDGARVVGPVDTSLLLKGVSYGRVPDGCWIAQPGWGAWRNMDSIREVRALKKIGMYEVDGLEPWERVARSTPLVDAGTEKLLSAASDPGELVLFGMHEMLQRTRASVGLVHRMRAPYVGLVTSCATGPNVRASLGAMIPARDPARDVARLGTFIAGRPWSSPARSAIADRLAGGFERLRGVAMVPLRCNHRLYAMIELGRTDHEFRGVDQKAIRAIAGAVVRRLETVTRSA